MSSYTQVHYGYNNLKIINWSILNKTILHGWYMGRKIMKILYCVDTMEIIQAICLQQKRALYQKNQKCWRSDKRVMYKHAYPTSAVYFIYYTWILTPDVTMFLYNYNGVIVYSGKMENYTQKNNNKNKTNK
jgi:hypothetical protein